MEAVEYLAMAEKYDLHRLAACCERFIAVHYDSLYNITQMQEISSAARNRMHRALSRGVNTLQMICRQGPYASYAAAPPHFTYQRPLIDLVWPKILYIIGLSQAMNFDSHLLANRLSGLTNGLGEPSGVTW